MDSVCESRMAIFMYEHGGIGFIHRFMSIEQQVNEVFKVVYRAKAIRSSNDTYKEVFGQDINPDIDYPIGAAIGIKEEEKARATALIEAGVDILMIDVAHAHHVGVKNMMKWLKENHPNTDLFVGTVATAEAVRDLVEWGADGIHVGVGGGSLCETRIRAGVGIPMISSVQECVHAMRDIPYEDKTGQFSEPIFIPNGIRQVPISSNGGIRIPGDMAKAIGAGADTVVLGSLLAGTKETPGSFKREGRFPNEQLYKEYRGSASLSSKLARGESTHIEGNSVRVQFKGSAKRIIQDMTDGLKSAMSYCGAEDIETFQAKCDFMEVTNAGQVEAKPHLMG
jgi:IMP dehydrogenase